MADARDRPHASFVRPDPGSFCRFYELGLEVAGQRLEPGSAVLVCQIVACLGVSWNNANDAVLAEGRRVLIEDPHRFDGVRVTGVEEHCWRQTRRSDSTSP